MIYMRIHANHCAAILLLDLLLRLLLRLVLRVATYCWICCHVLLVRVAGSVAPQALPPTPCTSTDTRASCWSRAKEPDRPPAALVGFGPAGGVGCEPSGATVDADDDSASAPPPLLLGGANMSLLMALRIACRTW